MHYIYIQDIKNRLSCIIMDSYIYILTAITTSYSGGNNHAEICISK
ncbi:Uncharacterised protein [Pragia fontium]|nr:Uncharacterised protein [Pragia fontium]